MVFSNFLGTCLLTHYSVGRVLCNFHTFITFSNFFFLLIYNFISCLENIVGVILILLNLLKFLWPNIWSCAGECSMCTWKNVYSIVHGGVFYRCLQGLVFYSAIQVLYFFFVYLLPNCSIHCINWVSKFQLYGWLPTFPSILSVFA